MILRLTRTAPKRLSSIRLSGRGIRRTGRSIVVLSAVMLMASGCGDSTKLDQIAQDMRVATTTPVAPDVPAESDGSSTPDDQEQAVVDYLRRGAPVREEEASCLVDGMNVAGIDSDSVIGATLTTADDTVFTDLILTCFENPEVLEGFVENFAAGYSVVAGFDLSIDQAGCMVAALDDNDATTSDLDAAELSPALQDALESCVDQNDAATDAGGLFEPGSSYGENPVLDSLWDECAAGDMASCDELYSTSEIGSEYETFGATCGQREPDSSGGTCDIPFTYGDNAALDSLWDACTAGDGASCDDLYFESPVGSTYENFGDTCGYRFDASPGFCEDAIG